MVKQPIRTCIGTGTKIGPSQLLRWTNQRGIPTPDLPGQPKTPGRGCYTLPTEEAYTQALKKKAFARHLRTNQPPAPWAEITQTLGLSHP